MLRLNKKYRIHISNRLASFAALLLVVTSLAGAGNPAMNRDDSTETAVVSAATAESAHANVSARKSITVKKNKGFKVSLFLFRNH